MEPRKIIRTDIAASAIAHLSLLALILVISEVHPFHPPPMETVSVDIVTPDEVKQQETKAEVKDKTPEPPADLKLPKLDFKDKAEDKPEAAAQPAKQAAKESAPAPSPSPAPQASPEPQQQPPQPQPSSQPQQREANAQPRAQVTPQPQPPQQQQPAEQPPQAQPAPQAPSYKLPEPDVTVKYGVMLGLPPELPPEPKDAPKDDGGDAKDSIAAKLPPEVVAAFRRHLRSCAKLPAGVSPSDNVRIRLRAVLASDGTLARAPILIEAPPSAKGPLLVQSAMAALQACQPYTMLPPDRYEEWKVMDLPFTPRDFGGA